MDVSLLYSILPDDIDHYSDFIIVQLLSLSDGERITSIVPVNEFGEDQYLVMLTVNGYIKKVPLNAFSAIRTSGIISIQLVLSHLFAHFPYHIYIGVLNFDKQFNVLNL